MSFINLQGHDSLHWFLKTSEWVICIPWNIKKKREWGKFMSPHPFSEFRLSDFGQWLLMNISKEIRFRPVILPFVELQVLKREREIRERAQWFFLNILLNTSLTFSQMLGICGLGCPSLQLSQNCEQVSYPQAKSLDLSQREPWWFMTLEGVSNLTDSVILS